MKKISITLSFSLALIMLMLGVGIGYAFTPDYRATMFSKETMDLGEADFFLDRRYLDAMISHHQGAMALAEQALENSQREEIQLLAKEILANEPVAIAELYAQKKDWYRDGRPAPRPTRVNLGTGDDNFDLRFLNALIAHHEEGLKMTAEIKMKSSRAAVLDNADAVTDFLSTSLENLKTWRQDWYKL